MNKSIIKVSCLLTGLLALTDCATVEYRSNFQKKQELTALQQELVHAKTGWAQQVGSGIGKINVKLQLAGTEDVIVASDAKGLVVAFDRKTGDRRWNTPLKVPVSAGPVVVDDKVFLGTSEAEMLALNLSNGKLLWRVPATSEILAAPAAQEGVLFVHTLDGGLTALSVDDGKQLWRFSSNIPQLILRRNSTPVVIRDRVVTGFASGKLVAINKPDGSVDWAQDVALPKGRSDIQRMVDISATPIVAQEIVYVVSFQGNLAAFSLKSGQALWFREISSISGMALANDALYVAASDGEVLAVDKFTGNTLWYQPQLKGRQLSMPVVYDGHIVVGDEDGYLHWLDPDQGQLIGRLKVASKGIEAEPLVYKDGLYVYSKDGKVSWVYPVSL